MQNTQIHTPSLAHSFNLPARTVHQYRRKNTVVYVPFREFISYIVANVSQPVLMDAAAANARYPHSYPTGLQFALSPVGRFAKKRQLLCTSYTPYSLICLAFVVLLCMTSHFYPATSIDADADDNHGAAARWQPRKHVNFASFVLLPMQIMDTMPFPEINDGWGRVFWEFGSSFQGKISHMDYYSITFDSMRVVSSDS
eukprot:658986-Pelagomonas_calceolata.AAC.2